MPSGEFDIIERYFAGRVMSTGPGVVLGPGDDCAVVEVPAGAELCISTDTLIEGVHLPAAVTGDVAAWRSVAANLSDLAAMGAVPLALTLALTLPEEDETWLEAFASTLEELVSRYAVPLIGGNLARGGLSITFTVFGTVARGTALVRAGAREGDDIYVSGHPGDAAAGLTLLEAHGRDASELVRRYEFPEPRMALGRALIGIASSAIDVSDALVQDLGHVAVASGVRAVIDAAQMPLSGAIVSGFGHEQALRFALSGGDDYELCFTAPADHRKQIESVAEAVDVPLTRIGAIHAGKAEVVVLEQGRQRVVSGGYQHFHAS